MSLDRKLAKAFVYVISIHIGSVGSQHEVCLVGVLISAVPERAFTEVPRPKLKFIKVRI